MIESRLERLRETFRNRYGHEPTHFVRAPGRVNLIGEHTDYNEGFVLPMAIDRDILVAASAREDKGIFLYAMQYGASSQFSLDLVRHSRSPWSNYVRGTVAIFLQAGQALKGFNAVFDGNIPQGGGLSSSAALEVAFALLMKELNGLEVERLELAKLAQKAENEFVGVQCGIMDQFASLFGKKEAATFLDCRDLSHKNIPLPLERHGLRLVVVDSGVKRGLIESEYNARRKECEQGVLMLKARLGRKDIRSLRDISVAEFTSLPESLPETVCKRSWHVISENARVLEAVDALQKADFETFGSLLNHSHESMRDDFEASCPEIDLLVSLAQSAPGVLGSRMTGAGFGGCTISLVKANSMDSFRNKVIDPYQRRTGHRAEMMIFNAVEGASRIEI